jgi:hypothetical protein
MEYTLNIAKTSSQQLHGIFHRPPKIIKICIYTHYTKVYNIQFYSKKKQSVSLALRQARFWCLWSVSCTILQYHVPTMSLADRFLKMESQYCSIVSPACAVSTPLLCGFWYQ